MSEEKILIVDDDEELQTLYGLYLQGESFKIARAFNGREALEKLSAEKPALIILDMIMPVMTGEAFIAEIHKGKTYDKVPIIIASVNDKISPKLFKQANVRAVLKKPFTVEILIGKVKEILNHHQG